MGMERKQLIIRSKRKTLSINIDSSGNITIHAPLKMPTEKIQEFIAQKRAWIERQLYKISQKQTFAENFDLNSNLYIFGEKCDKSALGRKSQERFYRDYAQNYLPKRLEEISKICKIGYNSVKIASSKRIWGSCSAKHEIKLNYKLIMLPKYISDYVILHELCHVKQLNHSPKFWAIVGKYCPNYKEIRNRLDYFGFLLK